MEGRYYQHILLFFLVFSLQLAWPPHSLACSTAPDQSYLKVYHMQKGILQYCILCGRIKMPCILYFSYSNN